ncbi:MAG: helix-turn-helix domain-containing protein [Chlamydiae bacterium]|nr:helix-turn-helix domain-containing protein [Chlamydiota bacterium]
MNDGSRFIARSVKHGIRPSELKEQLNIPQATLSFHLKQLQIYQLVVLQRKGTSLFYTINTEVLEELIQTMQLLLQNSEDNSIHILTKPRIKVKAKESIDLSNDL